MRALLSAIFGCMIIGLSSGCATQALWEADHFSVFKEPAKPSRLALFENPQTKKALVVYDEKPEMNEQTVRRAYWVDPSGDSPANPFKPHFVQVSAQKKLQPVPLSPQAAPAGISAAEISDQVFVFHRDGQPLGRHELPTYKGAEGRAKQAALTPLTIAADLTIIGGVIFVYYVLPGWAGTH